MAKVTNRDILGNPLTFDQMLKRFKKAVEKDQIIQAVRDHEYFRSKAIKRRDKIKRHQRLLRKSMKKRFNKSYSK